jgi:hypothetical protein
VNNGQSPEMQLREISEYCDRRGWTVAREYVDVGISAAKEKRPELDRLSRMLTAGASVLSGSGSSIALPGQCPTYSGPLRPSGHSALSSSACQTDWRWKSRHRVADPRGDTDSRSPFVHADHRLAEDGTHRAGSNPISSGSRVFVVGQVHTNEVLGLDNCEPALQPKGQER